VYAVPPDPAATVRHSSFSKAYDNGAKMAPSWTYVPLPESLIKQVRTTWQTQIISLFSSPFVFYDPFPYRGCVERAYLRLAR